MPATFPAAPAKAPRTDALLAIDALPVWRAPAAARPEPEPAAAAVAEPAQLAETSQARTSPKKAAADPASSAETVGAPMGNAKAKSTKTAARSKTADTSPAPTVSKSDAPITDAKARPDNAPRSGPAAARLRHRSGAVAVLFGVAAGVLLSGPFVNWRGAAQTGVSHAAAPQLVSALVPTLAAVGSARAVEAPEAIAAAPVPDTDTLQHAAIVETDLVAIVEAAAEIVDDARPLVVAFEESTPSPEGAQQERDIPATPVAARLPAQEDDAASIAAPTAVRSRVVVHYNADRQAAAAIAERLAGRGAGKIELRRVNLAIRRPELRIFREAEAPLAATLAGAVSPNAAAPVRNFSHFRPLPSPGLIEVWAR